MRKAFTWVTVVVGSLLLWSFCPAYGQEEAADPAAQMKQEFGQTMKAVREKEMQALRQDADLKAAIDELEKQRRAKFIEADPELADLYKTLDELKAKRRGGARQKGKKAGKAKGGKAGKRAGKARGKKAKKKDAAEQ